MLNNVFCVVCTCVSLCGSHLGRWPVIMWPHPSQLHLSHWALHLPANSGSTNQMYPSTTIQNPGCGSISLTHAAKRVKTSEKSRRELNWCQTSDGFLVFIYWVFLLEYFKVQLLEDMRSSLIPYLLLMPFVCLSEPSLSQQSWSSPCSQWRYQSNKKRKDHFSTRFWFDQRHKLFSSVKVFRVLIGMSQFTDYQSRITDYWRITFKIEKRSYNSCKHTCLSLHQIVVCSVFLLPHCWRMTGRRFLDSKFLLFSRRWMNLWMCLSDKVCFLPAASLDLTTEPSCAVVIS